AVARLNGVGARRGSGRGAACCCGCGRCGGLNVCGESGKIPIDELDLAHDAVFQVGRWSGGANEELVAFHVYVLKLDAVGLDEIQYRLKLSLPVLQTVFHWRLL